MYDLTEAQRNQIIGLFKGGATKKHIIKTLGILRATVYRTIQTFCEGRSLETQPRSGRPKLLNCEHQKTWRNLHELNIFSRIPASNLFLTTNKEKIVY